MFLLVLYDLDMKNKKISIIPWQRKPQGIIDTKIIILFYIDTIAKIMVFAVVRETMFACSTGYTILMFSIVVICFKRNGLSDFYFAHRFF